MHSDIPYICLVWPYFGQQYYDRYIATRDELNGIYRVKVIALSNKTSTYEFWHDTFDDVDYCFRDTAWEDLDPKLMFDTVYNKLIEYSPIAIFTHSYSTIDARASIMYSIEHNKRFCIMSDSKYDDYKRYAWKEFIKKLIINGSDGMLLSYKPQIDYYRKIGFRAPVYIGYNAISDINITSVISSKQVNELVNRYGKFIICVSRPLLRKRVPELVSVWNSISDKHDVKLLIIGGTVRQYDIQENTDVIVLGQKTQIESYHFIAASIGLILPSSEDQWGNVVSEALVLNKRVIVSSGCGISSCILNKSYGYVFTKNNWEELKKILMTFIIENEAFCLTLPASIRMHTFVNSIHAFVVDSYKSSIISKNISKWLVKLTLLLFPGKPELL